jgi:acyl-coenzyme A synthetase/AMP-(fatty) acid ligase
MVITSDGSYRGNKAIDLKGIVDEALEKSPCVEKVLVVKRTNTEVNMKEGRDQWLQPLMDAAVPKCCRNYGCRRSAFYSLYFGFYWKTKRNGAYYRWIYGLHGLYF